MTEQRMTAERRRWLDHEYGSGGVFGYEGMAIGDVLAELRAVEAERDAAVKALQRCAVTPTFDRTRCSTCEHVLAQLAEGRA